MKTEQYYIKTGGDRTISITELIEALIKIKTDFGDLAIAETNDEFGSTFEARNVYVSELDDSNEKCVVIE